jgi:hypothetical protein
MEMSPVYHAEASIARYTEVNAMHALKMAGSNPFSSGIVGSAFSASFTSVSSSLGWDRIRNAIQYPLMTRRITLMAVTP